MFIKMNGSFNDKVLRDKVFEIAKNSDMAEINMNLFQ